MVIFQTPLDSPEAAEAADVDQMASEIADSVGTRISVIQKGSHDPAVHRSEFLHFLHVPAG